MSTATAAARKSATVVFKGKVVDGVQSFVDGRLVTGRGIRVPAIALQHFADQRCTLARIGVRFADQYVRRLTGGWVMLEETYPGVTVDASGFLARVTVEVPR